MDTLYTFWDNISQYKTESVHFWGLMNSATKYMIYSIQSMVTHIMPKECPGTPQLAGGLAAPGRVKL